MADSMDDIVRALVARSKDELRASLRPALDRLSAAVDALNAALGDGPKPAAPARRGRPAGTASKAPAASKGRKAASAKPGRKKGRKAGKMPRGSLAIAIRSLLEKSSPRRVNELRDAIMAMPEYSGHQASSIYTQINTTLRRMPDAQQVSRGLYALRK